MFIAQLLGKRAIEEGIAQVLHVLELFRLKDRVQHHHPEPHMTMT